MMPGSRAAADRLAVAAIGGAIAWLAMLVAAPARAEQQVVTHISIAAPPARVWAILTDFGDYPNWNPFITRIAGRPAVGAVITADLHTTNLKPRTVQAKILVVDAQHQLRWLGTLPGLFSGEHYWIVRERPGGGAELEQGEVFRGVLVPFIKPERLRVDYEAMNRALKARAESAP
jgi:hypothetical protein